MKQKLATSIVKMHKLIMIVMILAALLLTPMILKTNINYDLTKYLSADTMTQRGFQTMQAEFGSNEQAQMLFENLSEEQLQSAISQLNALPQVLMASHNPETDVKKQDGVTYQLISLALNECDINDVIHQLRGMFPEYGDYLVGGQAAVQIDMQSKVAEEIPLVLIIAMIVVVIALLITSHSWIEPLLILILLIVSVLINMGTNFIFESVSFITFSVCAVLQLALSIDYSIMLLHSYNAHIDEGLSPRDAVQQALVHSLMPVSSSAMTTVAGLLSLAFMSFTIGFDIGVVLSKGIVISMLTVFLLMPGLILIFHKALRSTRHRPLQLRGGKLARGIFKGRRVLACLLIVLVIAGAVLQTGNSYFFTDSGHLSQGSQSEKINDLFGSSDPLALLVPLGEEDADYDQQRALCEKIRALEVQGEKGISDVIAMVTTGAAALEYYTAQDVAKMTGMSPLVVGLFFGANNLGPSVRADRLLESAGALAAGNETIQQLQETLALAKKTFHGKNYTRIMLLPTDAGNTHYRLLIEEIMDAVRSIYGNDFYLTGIAMSSFDIGNAFEGDLMKVNFITLIAILLIVALSFRSIKLPVLLVLVIEGAIWITMGISRLMNESIFFISYLICLSIQMGATIDYAILLTDQYRAHRAAHSPKEALTLALEKALPTILTSGVIMAGTGFLVGQICSIYYISSIGMLLARGTVISIVLILSLLPALLLLGDKWLIKQKKEA